MLMRFPEEAIHRLVSCHVKYIGQSLQKLVVLSYEFIKVGHVHYWKFGCIEVAWKYLLNVDENSVG